MMPYVSAATLPRPHPALKVMKERGLTQVQVARRLQCSGSYLSNALNGKVPVSPYIRRRISRLLGLPENELFHKLPSVLPYAEPADRSARRRAGRAAK